DDESDDDSSDDGEEASRILKKVCFPEVGKKPQDSCMLVATCLQKRSSKLTPLLDKFERMQKQGPLTTAQTKYMESMRTIVDKLTELEDTLTTMYSNGGPEEDASPLPDREDEAEMIFERSKNFKLPQNVAEPLKQEPKVKAKPKQPGKAKAAPKKNTHGHGGDDDEDEKPPGSEDEKFGRAAQYAEMLGEGVRILREGRATAKDTKRCIRQMQHPTEPEEKRRQAPNEERDCHRLFKRWGLSLPVPITEKTFVLDDSETADTAYIRVEDWLLYLLKRNRSLLAGGNDSLEFQLQAYWMAYRQTHSTHPVFERGLDLGTTIPLAFYSDEGKGPKRGNYVVAAIESPIGLQDVADDFTCTCKEDVEKAPQQFVPGRQAAGPYTPMEEAALKQNHTCKGHSYLTRHVLFGLPDWVYKHYPEVLEKMTNQVADELSRLFTSGPEVNGKVYTACLVGIKGDMKQIAEKIAYLNRYYARMGPVNYNGVCAHCMAGTSPTLPFDELSHEPQWASTLYQQRPWDSTPALCSVPHDPVAPEKVLKYDIFHCFKVGLGRDICGSVVLLARLGYYDDPDGSDDSERNIQARLNRAYQHFKLWRLASGKTAALRYFSKGLFSLKNLTDFAWSNTKGSDTTLLLQYIKFFVTILLQRPSLPRSHAHLFRALRKTITESQEAFEIMYSHGLWLRRPCAQQLYLRLMSVLSGYQYVAKQALTMGLTFYSLKPKFHAIHHLAYDLRVALLAEAKLIPNPITWNCEMGEDLIGRICSLSLKVSVTTINKRVLQRHFLKKAALIRRHRQDRSKRNLRL
ncbi:unnamed protein product, partial [Symbiodinium sp. CCMP2456]